MRRIAILALLLFLFPAPARQAGTLPVVASVSPPNWFAGHSRNEIQLLVRGQALDLATLVSGTPSVTVESQQVSRSGRTLIARVRIAPDAGTGDPGLALASPGGTVDVPFALLPRLAAAGRFSGLTPDDVIYLIMPDRFDDGDTTNDDPPVSAGHYDRSNPFAYHGGDLDGVIERLPYLKDLGVTALWLNPVYDNSNRASDYHGYGATDFYAVDEHLGTLDDYRRLVDSAHALGIKVIQDQVANHVGPDHEWVADPPTETWFNGTTANHLNNSYDIPAIVDPNASEARRRATLEGWFGNFLPDLNQNDPETSDYLLQNSLWWIETAGLDAIRQDTLPYVPRTYWAEWMDAIKAEHPQFTVIGEVFHGDPVETSFFQGGVARFDGVDSKVDTVFDFPLYFQIVNVFVSQYQTTVLRDALERDTLYPDPAILVSFIGNHDLARFTTRAAGDAKLLRLAQTFLLTTRGIPQLYYGDEIAMLGDNDPDNRRDFPGGFPGDPANAFTAEGRKKKQNAEFNYVRMLLAVRAAHPALRGGTTRVLTAGDTLIAYVRENAGERGIVVINNSIASGKTTLDVAGVLAEGQQVTDALGSGVSATVSGGKLKLKLKARSAVVLF